MLESYDDFCARLFRDALYPWPMALFDETGPGVDATTMAYSSTTEPIIYTFVS